MRSTKELDGTTRGAAARGYAVHLYTASGIVPALLAATEIASTLPDPRVAFFWLIVAVLIDSTDGPLARRFRVERTAPRIRGRTLDDIIDYLTFTFLPLLLVWKMGWIAPPSVLWVALAMLASLFGFAHVGAKEDDAGFFRGFPSYWNVLAFYAGIWTARWGPLVPTLAIVASSVLTVLPVHFVYPNRAPAPWRRALVAGGAIWLVPPARHARELPGGLLPASDSVSRLPGLLRLRFPVARAPLAPVGRPAWPREPSGRLGFRVSENPGTSWMPRRRAPTENRSAGGNR